MHVDYSTLSRAQLEALAQSVLEPERGSRVAPYLLGLIFDGLLQGVVFCQFAKWLEISFQTERIANRILGSYIFFVGIAYTIVQGARALYSFAYHYGEYVPILEGTWAMSLIILLLAIHWPTQIFYAERAYLLSGRNKFVLVGLTLMSLSAISVGVASMANFPTLLLSWTNLEINLLIASAVTIAATDVAITAIIITCLLRRRSGEVTGDRLISKLVVLSAESQLPPSILAIVLACIDGTGNIFVSPVLVPIMCKFSIMALFNVLNSRRRFREMYLPTTIVAAHPATDASPASSLYPATLSSDTGRHQVVITISASSLDQEKREDDDSSMETDPTLAQLTPPLSFDSVSTSPLVSHETAAAIARSATRATLAAASERTK